ncbi:J domain-containing protein [Paraburkholderia sp. HD33-4]|uniref:J domain-containing protein n=1 Tax=Paraburkholderia sp. HD33-4 TaxID=2883242 RepID=UPI001F3BA891|nr:DnaJ domain-containing protein [Paraburkholderia sp. HD33-4]
MHTHYDNLKVAPNAPLPVIKAAYRVLCQQYHPDRNDSPDATRIMLILNEAWTVLSDETKRAEYDRQLAAKAAKDHASGPTSTPPHKPLYAVRERRGEGAGWRQAIQAARQRCEAKAPADKAEHRHRGVGRQWKVPALLWLALPALLAVALSVFGSS